MTFGNTDLWQEWYSSKDICIEAKISCTYSDPSMNDSPIESIIRDFHSHHGHKIGTNTKIVYGNGSTQVILGLIYAISICCGKGRYYESVPYHPVHKNLVAISSQEWLNSPSLMKRPEIEFITSPNNPDGSIKLPVSNASILLWDAVYAWPWYGSNISKLISQVKKYCSDRSCILIFSFSKSLGLAGQRLGYALIPVSIQKQYPTFIEAYEKYITLSTHGICRTGEGICRIIASKYREFPSITETLEKRYDILSHKLYTLVPDIEILSPRGFLYMWVRSSSIQNIPIKGISGTYFGMTQEYMRYNLLIDTISFDSIISNI